MPARLDLGRIAGSAMPGDTVVLLADGSINVLSAATLGQLYVTSPAFGTVLNLGRDGSGALAGNLVIAALTARGTTAAGVFRTSGQFRLVTEAAGWTSTLDPTRAEILTAASVAGGALVRFIVGSDGTVYVGATEAGANLSIDQSGAITGVSFSGVAATATALATSRNIDGQGFNGTAAITVIAPGTHAATTKATPVDADEIPIVDSAASNVLKKLTWANLKATLKTYFDTLYDPVGSAPATLGNHFANVTVTGDSADHNIWSDLWAHATQMQTNGDKVRATYHVQMAANTHARTLKLNVTASGGASTQIASLSTASASDLDMFIEARIIRESSSVLRCSVKISGTVTSLPPTYTRITGLTLGSTDYSLDVVGNNTTLNDITGRMGNVEFVPA